VGGRCSILLPPSPASSLSLPASFHPNQPAANPAPTTGRKSPTFRISSPVTDLAWTYEEPDDDGRAIRGLICFFSERVDLEVDGQAQERPTTQWSH
jgi:hypothetical protein